MNKQQIVQKLSYLATSVEDANMLRAGIFRFIGDLMAEDVTQEKTYSARSFPVEVRQEIILRDHYTCAYCNRVGCLDADPDGISWTIDHVIPYSKGGVTCADNGVLSCFKCNNEKRDMTPSEYVKWLRFRCIAVPKDDLIEGNELSLLSDESDDEGNDGPTALQLSIIQWRKENPDGRQCECIKDLKKQGVKLSKAYVSDVWSMGIDLNQVRVQGDEKLGTDKTRKPEEL